MTTGNDRKTRTALITGASAGIGRELALVFAENGFDLVLVARRKDRLEALAQEIQGKFGVTAQTLAVDLADPAAPRQIFDEMARRHIMVDALVNNAGFTVPGYFRDTHWEDQKGLIQVMVTAVA